MAVHASPLLMSAYQAAAGVMGNKVLGNSEVISLKSAGENDLTIETTNVYPHGLHTSSTEIHDSSLW